MGGARAAAVGAAAGWLLSIACSSVTGRRAPPPPDPDLRIWAPPRVEWPAGSGRSLRFVIENATERALEVPPPHPSGARVAIFPDAGDFRACGVEPGAPPEADAIRLEPGDQLPVTVDLGAACGDLPPGEYRYELGYRLPATGGAAIALQPRYGTLVVDGPAPAAARRGPEPVRRRSPRSP
jgi:hypothetical protein